LEHPINARNSRNRVRAEYDLWIRKQVGPRAVNTGPVAPRDLALGATDTLALSERVLLAESFLRSLRAQEDREDG